MCDCVETINTNLAPHNCKVAQAIRLTADMSSMFSSTIIATEKIDKAKRKAPPTLMATFCPFCGERENSALAKDPT